jgi:pyruvate dehydrogenase E2 component (dihydrolipoamide acetyltransferase)
MSKELTLPELGENVESGDVIKVLVAAGDVIEKEQPVLELETDKATIEVPAAFGGKIKEIHVKEGEKIKVGQKILTVDDAPASEQPKQERKQEPRQAATPSGREPTQAEKPAKTPAGQETPAAVRGQQETADSPQADKGRIESPKPAVSKSAAASETREAKVEQRGASVVDFLPAVTSPVPASPKVRRLAREIGVDIAQVQGTAEGGRISIEDVKEHARRSQRREDAAGAGPATIQLPDFSRWGEVERQPMSNIRRKTAEHVSLSWNAIPHVTQFDKADVSELEKLKERFAQKVEAAGGKLTMTAIALKVVAAALKAFPQFNASLDDAAAQIIYKKYIHVGVAVDTDRGLLVPVIRDVDKKNLITLSAELTQIAERARNKKLGLDEMQGGTFTITNLGGIGGTNFTPIVNHPEVAILGIARGAVEPVYVNGNFEPRTLLPLALSYDHRVIDGADAARFLRWIAGAMEQPFRILLEG